jgi:hypothetical protein
MKKQLVIIGIVAILVTVGLSGCNSSEQTPEELFIGKWHYEYGQSIMNLTFYENHSMCISAGVMSIWAEYVINENHIIVTNPDGNISSSEYSFSDNNQKLTITTTEGDVTVFTRQLEMKL